MQLRIMVSAILSFLIVTNIFAGTEDWNGSYSIELSDGNTTTVIHTPTFVKLSFLRAGKCIKLSKGSNINGIIPKQDISLCVSSNIDQFTQEVENLGIILEKIITQGPTYIPGESA